MSSRFVSAGTDQAPVLSDKDDWGKARQEVEKQRSVKPSEPGQQEGGKSLYEVLQANKAAKQEAFEEATKLRNQFRALDDSEIDFLDSVRESERAKEDIVRKETRGQLDSFRKQRSAAEQAAVNNGDTSAVVEQQSSKDTWTASRKRRREKTEEGDHHKLRKSTVNDQQAHNGIHEAKKSADSAGIVDGHSEKMPAVATAKNGDPEPSDKKPVGLGLSAYDSEVDDQ